MFIMLVLILSSCSMPETKIYTLSLPVPENLNNRSSDSSVSLRIHAPRYLEQPYIAHRVSEYQLEISRYSKWDSSPSDIVKTAFKDALSPLFREIRTSGYVPEGFYIIDLTLRKFERTDTENGPFAELVFDIKMLSPERKEIYKSTVSKSVKLDGRDNPDLAKALSSALSSAVEETRNSISSKLNTPL
ncbi:MAG: hypothetical protein A2X59_08075 [Nitrospirae bacterium GWC2_42_7]|nr:MAG: hypothetical protein A2X59_08075 [Nitrospirae bacterium GWC2_42_7]